MLLKDKLAGHNLILASGSPRRRQILTESGLPFTLAQPYDVNEVWPAGLPAEQVADYIAALKSDTYPFPLAPEDILLTADTTVVLAGEVLGKPHDLAQAVRMLEKLSGRAHKVFTCVTLRNKNKRLSFTALSTVWFRPLTSEEIIFYVNTFRPLDKAGAYGIQEWIGYTGVERIEGSFHNVMGMPMQAIYANLDSFIS